MIFVFDLDGTLIDTSARTHGVYSQVVTELGGSPLSRSQFWALKRAKTRHAEILRRSGLGPGSEPEFLRLFIGLVEQPAWLRRDELIPGSTAALDLTQQIEGTAFLVSLRRWEERARAQISDLGLGRYFARNHIVTGHSEGDGYLTKIEIVNSRIFPLLAPHERIVMVGDTEADVLAAHRLAAGGHDVTAVGVTSGIRSAAFLANLRPDHLLDSVADLGEVLAHLGVG